MKRIALQGNKVGKGACQWRSRQYFWIFSKGGIGPQHFRKTGCGAPTIKKRFAQRDVKSVARAKMDGQAYQWRIFPAEFAVLFFVQPLLEHIGLCADGNILEIVDIHFGVHASMH